MSRRGARRRGTSRRVSNAVATWLDGSVSTANTTDYTGFSYNAGADASDRGFIVIVTQRQNATVDPDGVTLGGNAMTKIGSVGGNNINMSVWWLPGGVFPTGSTASISVDNPTSTGSRSMCRVDLFKVTGQNNSTPTWVNPVMNAGSGTVLDLSPPAAQSDGATIVASAAPGVGSSYTWTGATEAYDTNTESTDCRVSGGVATGLPAALSATTSGSVTNLMGAAVHIR